MRAADAPTRKRHERSRRPPAPSAALIGTERDSSPTPFAGPLPPAIRAVALPAGDWRRLRDLPWGVPLDDWTPRGVETLSVRRGESRHPVLFVERGAETGADGGVRRYAIKETSPEAAAHEIAVFEEVRGRGLRALEPVGHLTVRGAPIAAGEVSGRALYTSGDTGYCVTRLAAHVLPQSILYGYPFTDANKRLLWSAVAELLLDLHEAGVFWGDPSLANVLMDLSGHRLTAIMADAETARLLPPPLSEGLRRQDLDLFLESIAWQAEDIRLARDPADDHPLVTEGDAEYLVSRYTGLRAERAGAERAGDDRTGFASAAALVRGMRRLNALGYGMLHLSTRAVRASRAGVAAAMAVPPPNTGWRAATLRPGWYTERLRTLLGERVPRACARRIYQHILVHKWIMSERAGHDIGLDAAARDWSERIHQPAMRFVAVYLPDADDGQRYDTELAILDHLWRLSQRAGHPVPLEEGAMDYALAHTRGTVPIA